MQLQLKTWQFVEDYLKDKTGIIIPIGSTEQHGPTGLIGTDALTAEMIARGDQPVDDAEILEHFEAARLDALAARSVERLRR